MNMIDVLCYGGAAGAMVFALLMIAQAVFEDGWFVVPNTIGRTTEWIVDRTAGRRRWKAELEAQGLRDRIAELEQWSTQWETLRAQGRDMVFHSVFGWTADTSVCPCGYLTECAVWCGSGHMTGQCDHETGVITIPVDQVNRVRPLLRDTKGAGRTYER